MARRSALVSLLAIACVAVMQPLLAQNRAAKPLTIYVVDVEGGNGVLFVTFVVHTVFVSSWFLLPLISSRSLRRPRDTSY